MDENTFLQTIENSYKETDDGEFSTLSVLLTPMDLLKSDERFARAKLYQIDSEEVELDITHDRFNEKDNKALEVYYDKTFIGYIRKRFTNEYIDYTEQVNKFCFDEAKLKNMQFLWDGTDFIIRGKSFEKIQKLKEEKESLLKDIHQYGDIMFGQDLNTVSVELRNDKELVLEYVSIIGDELEYASERLKNDKEVVIAALNTNINARVVKYASNELKNDPEIIWLASKKNSNGFKYASKELLSNKAFILETIDKGIWWVFEYADERLRNDKEVVVHAIKQTGSNLEYCNQELQGNKKIVMMAVEAGGGALQYASKELQNDRDVVWAAVENSGYSLQYASDVLKKDRDIVSVAIKNNGSSFEYADKILRNDVEIASSALLHSDLDYWSTIEESIFENTTEDILKNKFFLLNAIKNNIPILKMLEGHYGYFNDDIWLFDINDKDIILTAYKNFGHHELQYASKILLSDKHFVLELINIDLENNFSNKVLYYLDDNFKNDIDIVNAAISKNWRELEYVSEELKNNKDVVMSAININMCALKYASEEIKNNKDIILGIPGSRDRAISGDHILKHVGEKLKDDKEVVIDAIKKDGPHSLQYANESMHNNKEVIMTVVREYRGVLKYASEELQQDPEIMAIIDAK